MGAKSRKSKYMKWLNERKLDETLTAHNKSEIPASEQPKFVRA
jgi:hypothetical protein